MAKDVKRLHVVILPDNVKKNVELEGSRVKELVKALGMSIEEVVVVREGRPLHEDDIVEDGEELTVIRAASGG
ncbi:MAG: thiamine biosynthesis protein ThiS [Hyperthermus sp.]|nr:MAG: thiamine biosynthesis protein ThiS [Hyperthermus sp.]